MPIPKLPNMPPHRLPHRIDSCVPCVDSCVPCASVRNPTLRANCWSSLRSPESDEQRATGQGPGADVDNDGWPDLLLGKERNQLAVMGYCG
jgi:hypothetical protein